MAGTIVFDSAQPDGHSFRVLSNTGTTLLTANGTQIVANTSLTFRGATSGSITLAAPAVAGSNTLTLPVASDTLVGVAATQTLTNKTLGSGTKFPTGCVIQVQTVNTDGLLSTTASGLPNTITNGAQVFSLSFTPLYSTSTLVVVTSTVSIYESTNGGDACWLSLWDGSTFIQSNGGTWTSALFGGYYNGAYTSIVASYSAGSTSARTIQVRAGMNAGSGTTYINGQNAIYDYTGSRQRITMTVWEIA